MRVGRRNRRDDLVATAEEHPNLVGGLAVVVAVTLLLELLRRAIGNRADRQITGLWISGRQLSQNVVGSHLLNDTLIESRKLVEELEHHVEARKESKR